MSLARPKSQIFTIFPCARRTLRAARSRWTHYTGKKETTSEWLQLRPDSSTILSGYLGRKNLPSLAILTPPEGQRVQEKGRHPMRSDSQPVQGGNREVGELRNHCYCYSKTFLLACPLPLNLWLGLKRSLCLELTFLEAKNSIPRAT